MDQPIALTHIMPFLEAFRHCFTAPAFGYFLAFVEGYWLADERRTVTNIWRRSGTTRHFSNFHRFLKTYQWAPPTLMRLLLLELLRFLGVLVAPEGVCVAPVALDDTLTRKWGKKMEGASWQYDAMAPHPKAKLAWGHCFVTLGLLARHAGRWLFLGFAIFLFRPPKVTEKKEQETKLALVARRLKELRLPAWLRLRVVADGAYGKKALVLALGGAGHHLISRLAKNAVLYDEPAPPAVKRRGRPRKYGEKRVLSHFARLTQAEPEQTLTLYGRECTVRLGSFVSLCRAFGGQHLLLVVVLQEGREPVYLFSTDLTLPAAGVVELYAARFTIELAFRDLKGQFGLGHCQARRAEATERHALLCLVAHTCSQLLAVAGKHAGEAQPWRKAPEVITTGQLRYRLRRESEAAKFLALLVRHRIPAEKCHAIYAELTA
jgi:hypothetical protein